MKNLLFFVLFVTGMVTAQVAPTFFQEHSGHGLTAVAGDIISADVNGDTIPDVFMLGATSLQPGNETLVGSLLFGDGDGGFDPAPQQPFLGLYLAKAHFVYVNGFPKYLVTTGRDADQVSRTRVYINNGNGDFTFHQELNGVFNAAIASGSLNTTEQNSIYLIISGSPVPASTAIYTYKLVSGFFTLVSTPTGFASQAVTRGDIEFVDYDNDGDLDVWITGSKPGAIYVSNLYRNNGNMNFSLVSGTDFPECIDTSITTAPLEEGNPYPWFIVTGGKSTGPTTEVYRNDNGVLTLAQSLPGVRYGSAKLKDMNGDGHLDLFIGGTSNGSNNYIARLFTNDGAGTLTQSYVFNSGFAEVSAVLIDITNDGKPDLIYTGFTPPLNIPMRAFINTTPWSYQVTTAASPANGGTVDGQGAYPWGSEVTLTATAAAQFEFVHWLDGNDSVVSTNTVYEFTLTEDEEFTAVFQPTMSTEDNILANLALYPNPTNGVVNISAPNGVVIDNVMVTDIAGRSFAVSLNGTRIDLSNFSSGIYMITLFSENVQTTKKVIKR